MELGVSPLLPISTYLLSLFIANLAEKNTSTSQLKSILAAIAWHHNINSLQDPTKSLYIRRMLIGNPSFQQARTELAPINKELLHVLLDLIPTNITNPHHQILLKAILLLMYHGCMRVGEAVVSASNEHTLTLKDVDILPTQPPNIRFTLNSYKHSKEAKTFILPASPATNYCPVNALLHYLSVRPPGPGNLFLHSNAKPVNRVFVANNIKLLVSLTARDPSCYNTHSLRIGRATDLTRQGVPEGIIKEVGRWNSDAYLKYVRLGTFTLPH